MKEASDTKAVKTCFGGCGGWSGDSADGNRLTTARLTGGLAALAHFRGTSCSVESRKAEHVIRRINGTTTPEIDQARAALTAMTKAASELIRRLQPEDFEPLVDLIFSRSGWRRESTLGGSQELIDIELMLPTTSERAFVQVKSETTPAEFNDYLAGLARHDQFARMFYVFHSGSIGATFDPRVTVWGSEKIAEMVVEAGLTDWLINKVP
jgi:hypothetical protein